MRLVIASHNPKKSRELQAILGDHGFSPLLRSEENADAICETGLSFVENAILKARHAAQQQNLPAIGDDSGLVVEALGGAPGIYSSRFAGSQASEQENIDKLLALLQEVPDEQRRAKFHTVVVFLRDATDPAPLIGEGSWSGVITRKPAGSNGFGYDPIFFLPQYNCTAAELTMALKNNISHRALALKQLISRIKRDG